MPTLTGQNGLSCGTHVRRDAPLVPGRLQVVPLSHRLVCNTKRLGCLAGYRAWRATLDLPETAPLRGCGRQVTRPVKMIYPAACSVPGQFTRIAEEGDTRTHKGPHDRAFAQADRCEIVGGFPEPRLVPAR